VTHTPDFARGVEAALAAVIDRCERGGVSWVSTLVDMRVAADEARTRLLGAPEVARVEVDWRREYQAAGDRERTPPPAPDLATRERCGYCAVRSGVIEHECPEHTAPDLVGVSEADAWFSYDPDDGLQEHNTAEQAREAAEESLERATDGEHNESVDSIRWGRLVVHGAARCTKRVEAAYDTTGQCEQHGWDYLATYEIAALRAEATPPVDLSALREAVRAWDEMADPFASKHTPLTVSEQEAMLAVVRAGRALVDATPAEAVGADRCRWCGNAFYEAGARGSWCINGDCPMPRGSDDGGRKPTKDTNQ
jgi:hypothetical protein